MLIRRCGYQRKILEKKVIQSKLANHGNAMGHPNADDLNKLKEIVKAL